MIFKIFNCLYQKMSATQVDVPSLRKLFSSAAKSLPEDLNVETFNQVKEHLITYMKNQVKQEKKKEKKKQNKGKKGPTAYFLFMKEHREEVKKEMGADAKITEISSKLGEKWRALSEAEQNQWREKAKALAPPKEPKPEKPKSTRPKSAFFVFSAEHRENVKKENPDKNLKEINSLLGQMWRDLTDSQKEDWKTKAKSM